MIKRLILLFLLFLSFSLMGTTAKAMDCEWVSNFKNNPGLETDVSNKNYLKTPIPREEYKRLLESFSSYSDCVDKEIKMILTKMSSLETAGTNRAQLILTLEEKLKEIKQISQKNLKMELAYKLLDDAITVRFKGNVVKQKNFREEIEKTISKYHGTFENYESVFPLFEEVAQKIEKQVQRGEQLQMSDEEIAFYDILKMGKEYLDSDKIAQDIARNVVKYLKKNLKIDWVNQQNVHDAINVGITKILLKEEFPIDKIDEVIPVIMQQTENNYSDFGM